MTHPTNPPFDSFSALPAATREALYATGWGEPALRVIFNAGRFPIWYHSDFTEAETRALLQSLFDKRAELHLDDCHAYNQWLKAEGLVARVPLSLRGKCIKADPKERHPDCKHLHRWTCGGCGKTTLPGSLMDPVCTVYPDPWWMEYIGDHVRSVVAAEGGPSKTDPLIWYPAGPRRNGRTIRYDPDSE